MKKSEHVLFTVEDEEEWSKQIVSAFPRTAFIDGNEWQTREPPTKMSISECGSGFAYIWNREIYPTLPVERLVVNRFRGPQAGMVIQLMRSVIRGSEMLSGDLSVGITVDRPEHERMVEFARSVLRKLNRLTSKRALQIDPITGEILRFRNDILIGHNARKWCLDGNDRYLRFHNSPHIYMRPD